MCGLKASVTPKKLYEKSVKQWNKLHSQAYNSMRDDVSIAVGLRQLHRNTGEVTMIHRSLSVLALAACILAPLGSYAASMDDTNSNIAQAKGPMVHVTLKNVSNLTQNLLIQGRPVSLAPNETYKLTAPSGTQVLDADQTVKLTVLKQYEGAVASFR
jgi:hypothetical protein